MTNKESYLSCNKKFENWSVLKKSVAVSCHFNQIWSISQTKFLFHEMLFISFHFDKMVCQWHVSSVNCLFISQPLVLEIGWWKTFSSGTIFECLGSWKWGQGHQNLVDFFPIPIIYLSNFGKTQLFIKIQGYRCWKDPHQKDLYIPLPFNGGCSALHSAVGNMPDCRSRGCMFKSQLNHIITVMEIDYEISSMVILLFCWFKKGSYHWQKYVHKYWLMA